MLAIIVNPMADGGAVLLCEDVTDRQIAEAKTHRLARFDTLTGLPNRAFLHDQTEAALAALKRRGPFATLLLTSTTSSRSTTPWATPVVTPCSAR